MIKLNLLPAYIIERRAVRRLMNVFVAFAILLLLGIVAVSYGYYGRSTARVNEDLQQNWAAGRDEANDLNSKISALTTDRQSRLDVFLQFKDDVDKHNQQFPTVLAMINDYIYKEVVVAEIELENDQVTVKARIDNNENLAKFYKNLRRCPALVPGSVKIDKVETYPVELKREGGESRPTYRPGPGAPGLPDALRGSEFAPTDLLSSDVSFDPSTGLLTRRIPRAEYEFTVTATLMPDYALAPPSSPLTAAPEAPTSGRGAIARPTGAPPSPAEDVPSGATGRRQLRENMDE